MPTRTRQARNAPAFRRAETGITGLETAIVLIAFVVVSSVLAFSTLSMGLFSSDKAESALMEGLEGTRSALVLRGAVTAEDTDTNGYVDRVHFLVSIAAGGAPVSLTPGATFIRYMDPSQMVAFSDASKFSVVAIGAADSDYLAEASELLQVTVLSMEENLSNRLGARQTFTLELMTADGPVLHVERMTPPSSPAATNWRLGPCQETWMRPRPPRPRPRLRLPPRPRRYRPPSPSSPTETATKRYTR